MEYGDITTDDALAQIFTGTNSVIMIVLYVLFVIACWRIFTKAGRAGILSIIPIVNVIILVRIAGYSGWLALLYLIPIVNVIFTILVALRLGKNFGKGPVFSIFLLWLFQIIGYLIIGFGDAKYQPRN